MRHREWTALVVVSLLGLAQTEASRSLLYTGGSTSLKGAAFGDNANFFWTTGNGSWVTATDYGYSVVTDYVGRSTSLAGVYPNSGVLGVTFPSKYLGVAVGVAPTTNTATTFSATFGVTTQQVVTSAVPTILLSVDGALSWTPASGIPVKTKAEVPDLFGVTCASRTLCWAVGGSVAGDSVATAAILISTAGPGSWAYALCPSTFTLTADQCQSGQYLTGGSTASTITADVAALLSVTSDSAGRNVYAVGAQRTPATYTPPIMYSGNSGISWVAQVAPAISVGGSLHPYSLTSVSAATGKIVYAAGGTLDATALGGVVLLTVNGGFTWLQQTLQWQYTASAASAYASTSNVGAVHGISYNRNKAVDATVWAVGAANNVGSGPCYNIMRLYLPQGTASASLYASFVTIPTSALPAAFGLSCTGVSPTMYGIVWDNPLHGWIYGEDTILVTHNGGANWLYESPNSLLVPASTNPTQVQAMANVPSNF